jgi:hypothetical protein
VTERRFLLPWTVEELDACYVVRECHTLKAPSVAEGNKPCLCVLCPKCVF